MPALKQLERIVANRKIVNPALQKIGGIILDGWIWSSSEYSYGGAWYVFAGGGVGSTDKGYAFYVRCVLAF